MLMWKFVGASKSSVIYIYIDKEDYISLFGGLLVTFEIKLPEKKGTN